MKTIGSFTGPYRFLSNFWSCCIAFEGHSYRTVEHAFQAAKTLDEDERRRIRNEPSAAGAKQRGKHATLREDWEQIKVGVMRDLLRQFDPIGNIRHGDHRTHGGFLLVQ